MKAGSAGAGDQSASRGLSVCLRASPHGGQVPRGSWTRERVWPESSSCVAFLPRPRKLQTPEYPRLVKPVRCCLLGSHISSLTVRRTQQGSQSPHQQEKQSQHEGGPAWSCHPTEWKDRWGGVWGLSTVLPGAPGPSPLSGGFQSCFLAPRNLSGSFHGFTSGCKAHFPAPHDKYTENGAPRARAGRAPQGRAVSHSSEACS